MTQSLGSFSFICKATFERDGFDIDPLWEWLSKNAALSSDATRESEIVWSSPGIFTYRPPFFDEGGRQVITRAEGVWQALSQCYLAVIAHSEQAKFLIDFAEVLSGARNALIALTRAIDKGSEPYLGQVGSYLHELGSVSGTERKSVLNAVNLPGLAALAELSSAIGKTDNVLANMHTDVTRRLSSPIPIEPPPKRGHPERKLLREVEMILHKAGFSDAEICVLVIDGGVTFDAIARTKERRRKPRQTRRRCPAQEGQLHED